MSFQNKKDWFDAGYVFDFDKQCLVNYKTGEVSDATVSHYLYGEDGSCFVYEDDFKPYLNFCDVEVYYRDYIFYDTDEGKGFDIANNVFCRNSNKLFRYCTIEDYFYTSEKWYEVWDKAELSLDKKLAKITWMHRG